MPSPLAASVLCEPSHENQERRQPIISLAADRYRTRTQTMPTCLCDFTRAFGVRQTTSRELWKTRRRSSCKYSMGFGARCVTLIVLGLLPDFTRQTSFFSVDSLDCPRSYPVDLMHVLFENIAPQLISLWKGTYKAELIIGTKKAKLRKDYVISAADWSVIEEEIHRSNKTTPSQAVPRVGNIKNKSFWTAETYSYFLMFLGPIVLKDPLPEKYYKHFILLSEITKKLAMLEIEWDALEGLHKDIVRWVRAFEQ